VAINSTDPVHLASPAEAGRFYGLATNGAAGAAVATGLLRLVVRQGNGVAPGLGHTAVFVAATDRPPASRAGVLASGGPTEEVGDVG
jgi:hypothetical protein